LQEIAAHQRLPEGIVEAGGRVDSEDAQTDRILAGVEDAAGPENRGGRLHLAHGAGLSNKAAGIIEQVFPLQADFFIFIGFGPQLQVTRLQLDRVLQGIFHHACDKAVHHDEQRQPQADSQQ